MGKLDIKQLFLGLQREMIAEMQTIRENIDHAPTMGDGSESVWATWLRTNLPNRYNVDKAIVIDHEGNQSEAIDVVIYDQQYTPFVLSKNSVKLIPAESVYAVFEAKQDIDKAHILYAGGKAKTVRSLKRTSAKVVDKGVVKDAPVLFTIMAGILTLGNGWKKSLPDNTFFSNAMGELKSGEELNLGCVLMGSSFDAKYNPSLEIKFSTEEESLIFFFLRLTEELQKLGTVRPIDLRAYSQALDSI
ncbi:MAG: hypothetical protein K9J17_05410 [Flavobacteriales bacterium]|nr:hypothetical protein [Flavobacteriales bacterium]